MVDINKAKRFATKAHKGQVRKYTGEPYIVHPAEVVSYVKLIPHTPEMIAAAWLHDVVEDCGVSIDQIIKEFGHTVARYVIRLTNGPYPPDLNRAQRKQIDAIRLGKSCSAVQSIKCADFVSNTKSIAEHDPKFAEVYLKEKRAALDLMHRAHPTLKEYADKSLRQATENLNLH